MKPEKGNLHPQEQGNLGQAEQDLVGEKSVRHSGRESHVPDDSTLVKQTVSTAFRHHISLQTKLFLQFSNCSSESSQFKWNLGDIYKIRCLLLCQSWPKEEEEEGKL